MGHHKHFHEIWRAASSKISCQQGTAKAAGSLRVDMGTTSVFTMLRGVAVAQLGSKCCACDCPCKQQAAHCSACSQCYQRCLHCCDRQSVAARQDRCTPPWRWCSMHQHRCGLDRKLSSARTASCQPRLPECRNWPHERLTCCRHLSAVALMQCIWQHAFKVSAARHAKVCGAPQDVS